MKATDLKRIRSIAPNSLMVSVALVLGSAWAVGCAKVGPPSGGDVDRLAPRVLFSRPAPDTTGVSLDRAIAIAFSEAMDRSKTEDAIYVSPRAELRLDWHGHELRIRPKGRLLPDRTYVVTVGTDARDLRGNRLERSYTFAFATGAQLNRGRLSGAVHGARGPASGAQVWAYDVTRPDEEAGELGVAEPSYQTQTGSDGTYEFLRLSQGTYRVVAFGDKNDNGRYDGGEELALPARDASLEEGGEVDLGALELRAPLAGPVALVRAQAVDAGRVLLAFDREVDATQVAAHLGGLEVTRTYPAADDGRRLYLMTTPQEAGRTYELKVTVAGQTVKWSEPVRGNRRADSTPPTLVADQPGDLATAGDTLVLALSEPLARLPGQGFWVEGDSTEAPAGRWREDGLRWVFSPDSSWAVGSHHLVGRLHELEDLAGLAPADSFVTVDFEVVAAGGLAALGGRVSGGDGQTVWVVAAPLEGGEAGASQHRVRAGEDGSFVVEGLLPGPTRLSAFEDRNGNGVRDGGQRHPFEPAEAAARVVPDPAPGRGDRITDLILELR